MLSKFSGSHQNLRYVFLLSLLLGTLGISLFLAVSMGSVQISLSDTYRIILSQLGAPFDIGDISRSTLAIVWNMRLPRGFSWIDCGCRPFHVWQCHAVNGQQSNSRALCIRNFSRGNLWSNFEYYSWI